MESGQSSTKRDEADRPAIDRRAVLQGVAGAGLLGLGLAACGGNDGGTTSGGGTTTSASPTPAASQASGASGALVTTAQVPVGGGVVLGDQKVVVTQPTEGTFKAFSAVCTHARCTVGSVADGTINCPCHGSKFSIEDGSVENPPAQSPLPSVGVRVEGGSVVRA